MPTHKLTAEIINAALEGFEQQKLRIDAQIAELRQMLQGGPTATAATPEVPKGKRRKMNAAARFVAHRFFNAATIAALPAALSLRFGLAAPATGSDGADSCLASGHRFRWASAIRARPAALILRLRFVGAPGAAVSVGVPVSIWRSSAI